MRKKYLGVAVGLLAGWVGGFCPLNLPAAAASCPDVRVVFARGSGGTRWEDDNYVSWRDSLDAKLKTTGLSYDFIDLDYPAVGIDDVNVFLGAWVGAGEAYEFGTSVNKGVANLVNMVNSGSCAKTKYVIGGYSQGAMVVSKALRDLNAERVIYAATFGDPKIYLPEGRSVGAMTAPGTNGKNTLKTGTIPAACKNENLSEYRAYVPDCYAYEGLLGSYQPYEPLSFAGKVGTWCNKMDVFCSSYWSIVNHVSYVADNLYEDAAKLILSKVNIEFGLESKFVSAHDTAIVIDSTGSMAGMLTNYKKEALRLARETLDAGGRVALYDYRDLDDPYEPVEHCNFENCTLEIFEDELEKIKCGGGGDEKESLLSASYQIMQKLNWRLGATKSLVVLTDAGYLSPDRDGTTLSMVAKLSKSIDPVNFYIVTYSYLTDEYEALAAATDGKVAVMGEGVSLLTNEIMERFDSLPRVEEDDEPVELPWIEISNVVRGSDGIITVQFESNGVYALAALNDAVLGMVEVKDGVGTLTIREVDYGVENTLALSPLSETRRGESVKVVLNTVEVIPKAPDTGQA